MDRLRQKESHFKMFFDVKIKDKGVLSFSSESQRKRSKAETYAAYFCMMSGDLTPNSEYDHTHHTNNYKVMITHDIIGVSLVALNTK